jgi:hypothetical protein
MLMRGELPVQPSGVAEERVVLKDDLYERYVLHAQIQGASHRTIETKLGMFLGDQLGAKLEHTRPRVRCHRYQCFRLPPLAECRALFSAKLGQKVD